MIYQLPLVLFAPDLEEYLASRGFYLDYRTLPGIHIQKEEQLVKVLSDEARLNSSVNQKYHDFFQAENRLILTDIGHYESEQFTKEIFYELVTKKISNFAIQFSKVETNPIHYL